MKIVQIIPSLQNAGGAEKFVVDLSTSLVMAGHEVTIIVLYKDDTCFYENEIAESCLKVIYLNKKRGLDLINSKLLAKRIREIKPNIVHTHVQSHLSLWLSGITRKQNSIRFFHTIHNVPNIECPKPILFRIMKSYYRKKIVIPIAISDSLAIKTKEYYSLDYLPVVIYNGFFNDKFENNIPILNREYSFITVASFHPQKNQISTIKAAIKLRNKGYHVKVIFLGDGSELEKLKKYVKDNSAEDYIDFKGRVKNVAEFLSRAKCFVLPSFYEGNPISILEAMAAGLAVIATSVGGAADVISNSINGFLVDPYDLNDLEYKMEKIIQSDDLLKSMSDNNIDKASSFNMTKIAVKYIKIYEQQ